MRICSIDLHYILTFTKTNRLSANRNPRNSLTMASQRKYPLSDLRKMATFYLAFTQAFINVGIVLCVNAIAWRVWFISVYRPTLFYRLPTLDTSRDISPLGVAALSITFLEPTKRSQLANQVLVTKSRHNLGTGKFFIGLRLLFYRIFGALYFWSLIFSVYIECRAYLLYISINAY